MKLNFTIRKDASPEKLEKTLEKLRGYGARVTQKADAIDVDFSTEESWKKFQKALRKPGKV